MENTGEYTPPQALQDRARKLWVLNDIFQPEKKGPAWALSSEKRRFDL